jgi:hypothetical protein
MRQALLVLSTLGLLLPGCTAGVKTMPLDRTIRPVPVLSLMQGKAVDGSRGQVSGFLADLFEQMQGKNLKNVRIVSSTFQDTNRWLIVEFHEMDGGIPHTGVTWTANIQVITSDLVRSDTRVRLRLIEMTNSTVHPGQAISDESLQRAWTKLGDDIGAFAAGLGQVA